MHMTGQAQIISSGMSFWGINQRFSENLKQTKTLWLTHPIN